MKIYQVTNNCSTQTFMAKSVKIDSAIKTRFYQNLGEYYNGKIQKKAYLDKLLTDIKAMYSNSNTIEQLNINEKSFISNMYFKIDLFNRDASEEYLKKAITDLYKANELSLQKVK